MPAVRSFYTLSVLAACLAQVLAGGDGGQGGQGGWGGQGGGNYQGGGGGGGDYSPDKGYTSQWNEWQTTAAPVCEPTIITKWGEAPPPMTVTVTYTKEGEKVTVTSVKEGDKATITQVHTITVTAAAPCTSAATAYVTKWQYAPPGCWCDAGSPPAAYTGGGEWAPPAGAAIFTAAGPIVQGRSSIPAADALKTGVTVAAPAPAPTGAPAPPAGGPPAGFFTSSSGTETSGSSSVPSSNNAQPTEAGGFPTKPVAPPAASISTSSKSSAAPPSSSKTTTAPEKTSTSSTTTASTSIATAAALSTSAPAPVKSDDKPEEPLPSDITSGGFPAGSFKTLDSATLTLKNAYTLGIGKRQPQPTL